jgi:hypothetical protein
MKQIMGKENQRLHGPFARGIGLLSKLMKSPGGFWHGTGVSPPILQVIKSPNLYCMFCKFRAE